MLHKGLFVLAHEVGDPSFLSTYRRLTRNQWRPYVEQKAEQERHLRRLVRYAYDNVPFYSRLFKGLNLSPDDIRVIEDLEKLPVLTKDFIKSNWELLKPINLSTMRYYSRATGGSTGAPMQYRLSKHDRFLDGAILYRGWGHGGYRLGDRMAFLAGTSLDVGLKSSLSRDIQQSVRNLRKMSSFEMGEQEMRRYAGVVNSFRPLFLRGYAAAIFCFSRWLEENDLAVHSPNAVFTTAEKLFPNMRKAIGDAFGCEVYDNYGLNDGGVSAYECSEHDGLHVDTERSVLEVVDGDGANVDEREGRILATSLHNLAMPFIRYDTGDLGILSRVPCPCGRGSLLIKDIVGRQKELLITPQGQHVHGASLIGLLYMLMEGRDFPDVINKIKEFQIIQRRLDLVEIRFACAEPMPEAALEYIRSVIEQRYTGWKVDIRLVDRIEVNPAGKHRFIINEVCDG